jgi:hypothetical protein
MFSADVFGESSGFTVSCSFAGIGGRGLCGPARWLPADSLARGRQLLLFHFLKNKIKASTPLPLFPLSRKNFQLYLCPVFQRSTFFQITGQPHLRRCWLLWLPSV